jgi:hypothetical protein
VITSKSIISILNEDKFSKYTLPQIYDELGQEDFADYIEALYKKAVSSVNSVKNMSVNFKGFGSLQFISDVNKEDVETLMFYYNFTDKTISVDYTINGSSYAEARTYIIYKYQVDILKQLKKAIINVYNQKQIVKARKVESK